jgi:glutathione peroxidase
MFHASQRIIAMAIAVGGMLIAAPTGWVGAEEAGLPANSVLDFEARRLSGKNQSLGDYRGQVLLIVNTASRCGYTPQYDGLEALYEKYRSRGFSVLGFPSNDFGAQEPGSDLEIGAFCKRNYGVEFPMFSKVKVRGKEQHALYGYLTKLPDPVGGPVRWNFQKYLVDRSGRVVSSYPSGVEPLSGELVASIEALLDDRPSQPDTIRSE